MLEMLRLSAIGLLMIFSFQFFVFIEELSVKATKYSFFVAQQGITVKGKCPPSNDIKNAELVWRNEWQGLTQQPKPKASGLFR